MLTRQYLADLISDVTNERTSLASTLKINLQIKKPDKKERDARTTLKRRIKALKQKSALLNLCLRYLESEPREEFMQKERTRLKHRLELINKDKPVRYESELTPHYNGRVKEYDKLMGTSKTKEQLRVIEFILNDKT